MYLVCLCLQCFDTVGRVAGRALGPVKTEWCSAGIVICLELGADMLMAQLMPLPLTVSCFSKIQLGLPFWYRLTRVVPEKGPLNRCVCACSRNVSAKIFWQYFPDDWQFWNKILCTLYVYVYTKLQHFILLSLTFSQLCHVKHDYLTNFYILHKKCKKLWYLHSGVRDLHKI